MGGRYLEGLFGCQPSKSSEVPSSKWPRPHFYSKHVIWSKAEDPFKDLFRGRCLSGRLGRTCICAERGQTHSGDFHHIFSTAHLGLRSLRMDKKTKSWQNFSITTILDVELQNDNCRECFNLHLHKGGLKPKHWLHTSVCLTFKSILHWLQIGITSLGKGCGDERYPGFYTRVTSLYPWLINITAGYTVWDSNCKKLSWC